MVPTVVVLVSHLVSDVRDRHKSEPLTTDDYSLRECA
ncbi:MAG: hypothetical protein QOJ59_3815 [Thermomicrobiales bacterium]|nr:hypothetical protein [Thermomicrobiales bacterium]MEA2523649.1 hypothetical protein [Thermomicrobiales bacterium]